MRPRVLVATRTFGSTSARPWEILAAVDPTPLVVDVKAATDVQLAAAIRDVDGVIIGGRPITAEMIRGANRLRVIAMHGVGVDHIDLDAAREQGVIVANSPGANTEAVADLTLGLLLALARSLPSEAAALRRGEWTSSLGFELADKTLGLIGFGRIGQAVARRATAFGMRVVASDPYVDGAVFARHGVTMLALGALLATSDVVSVHAPGGAEAHHLIDAARLSKMKPSAYLINTSRGDLVDEDALRQALIGGRLAGAGLDVFSREPPPVDGLVALANVVATPHVGAHTTEAVTRASVMAAENVVSALTSGEARWPVP